VQLFTLSKNQCSQSQNYALRAKSTTLSEVERSCSDQALIALTSTRHSEFKSATPNVSVSAKQYGRLLQRPHVVVNEDAILERYLRGLGTALASSDSEDVLDASPLIDIVASYDSELLGEHGQMQGWPHAEGKLTVNSLYQILPETSGATLKLNWPSEYFITDNPGIEDYLPESAFVSQEALDALTTGAPHAELEKLKANVVLVDLPDSY